MQCENWSTSQNLCRKNLANGSKFTKFMKLKTCKNLVLYSNYYITATLYESVAQGIDTHDKLLTCKLSF